MELVRALGTFIKSHLRDVVRFVMAQRVTECGSARPQILILLIILGASCCFVSPVAARVKPIWGRESGEGSVAESSTILPNDAGTSLINAPSGGYVFVGGQNGTWFEQGQSPRAYQIYFQNFSSVQLTPVRSGGTVWGGGFNGSQLLVSGWGSDDASLGPYICLYDGAHVVTAGSLDDYGEASSWSGGDVFSASYNGKEWLLSGLGSGPLPPYDKEATNHMSLGTFNGHVFTDLSSFVPDQLDAILYTNAWNGQYWLVGGGYKQNGVLFTFNGSRFVDLTAQAESKISSFASVQSVGWNGSDWLIGGVGFLAEYDGHTFTDLTPQLANTVSNQIQSVNAIAWNGQSWMIGGGTPVAQLTPSHAWVVSYTSTGFADLSSMLPSYVSNGTQSSSILTITSADGVWTIGGYSGNKGILLAYNDGTLTDYSRLVSSLSYVNWVSNAQNITF